MLLVDDFGKVILFLGSVIVARTWSELDKVEVEVLFCLIVLLEQFKQTEHVQAIHCNITYVTNPKPFTLHKIKPLPMNHLAPILPIDNASRRFRTLTHLTCLTRLNTAIIDRTHDPNLCQTVVR